MTQVENSHESIVTSEHKADVNLLSTTGICIEYVQWKLGNASSDNTKALIIQGDFQVPTVSLYYVK